MKPKKQTLTLNHGAMKIVTALILSCLLAGVNLLADPPRWNPETAVREVAKTLEERFALEDVAKRYSSTLRERLAAGRYTSQTNGEVLARQLTAELQSIHPDRHLRVRFSPGVLPPQDRDWKPTPAEAEQDRRRELKANVGFEKIEVLPGNIGYLNFRYFGDPALGASKLAAAMQFLADTDALVLDLRHNGGATHPGLMDLLTRYLVRDAEVVTAEVKWRGTPPEFMTNPEKLPVTGARYLDRPVFILTSGTTFSGAEGFTYNLQAMKRVTVVGQRTGGGANPGGEVRAGDHFAVWVPFGHTVHPVTKTSWEGVGVIPEVECRSKEALARARIAALDQMLKGSDHEPEWRAVLERERTAVQTELARQTPVVEVPFQLGGHALAKEVSVVGTFNDWSPRNSPMQRTGDHWKARVPVEPGRHEYKFWVDGEWLPDPANAAIRVDDNGNTNSLLQVTSR